MQPLGRCLQKTQRALRTSSLSPELTANFPRHPLWLPGAAVVPRPVPWATDPPQGRLASPSALLPSGVELLPPPPCTRPRPPPRSTTRASWRCSEVSTGPGGPVMPAGDPIGLTLWGTQPAHNRASWGQPCALHAKAGGQRCRAPRTAVHGGARGGDWAGPLCSPRGRTGGAAGEDGGRPKSRALGVRGPKA